MIINHGHSVVHLIPSNCGEQLREVGEIIKVQRPALVRQVVSKSTSFRFMYLLAKASRISMS